MTIDFSRNYQPPGVYVEETPSTVVATVGVPLTVVAIVGPARGHQSAVGNIPLANAGVRLPNKGIDTASVVLTVVSDRSAVDSGDYTVAKADDAGGQDYYTEITRVSDATVTEGTAVFVAYNYLDPGYFDAKSVESFEDVKDLYGEPLNMTEQDLGDPTYQVVSSPLSLAAKIAFENGANQLVLVATAPPPPSATTDAAKSAANRTALAAGYQMLSTLPTVTTVVGVTEGIIDGDAPGVLTDLSAYLGNAADDGFYQFGVTGFGTAVDTTPDQVLATSGVVDKRLMLAYAGPGSVTIYSGVNNTTFPVNHCYLAAAYGGKMASLPVQQSLTKQVLSSFAGLGGTPLSNSLKNTYASLGVAISEINRLGSLTVRHAVTTDMSSVNTRESAVVRGRDALVTMIQDTTTDSTLIGAPVDDNMLISVKSVISNVLETAVATGTINSYAGLAVRQLSTDPTVVEAKFSYKPAYPLNYIVVSFSIDMSTGDVTTTAA